jgi:hypothetical protein
VIRKAELIAGAVVLAILVILWRLPDAQPAASGKTQPEAEPAPPSWIELKAWTGNGIRQTRPFTISSSEWRIAWLSTASVFNIYVYDARTGALVTTAAAVTGKSVDSTYLRTPPGRYYLQINASNGNWAVSASAPR